MQTPVQPNFLIIGAAKAATTSLATMLSQHPDVTFSRIKEPHFFSNPQRFNMGMEWYNKLFESHLSQTAIGEASTSYSRVRTYPNVAKRIHRHLPDAKIIYMVRHPFERISSAYLEWLATADFKASYPSLAEALHRIPAMIDSSRHFEVFDAYRRLFSDDHIKIVWFEEFTQDTGRVFSDICEFLGIAPRSPSEVSGVGKNDQANVLIRLERLGRSIEGIDMNWSDDMKQYVLGKISSDMHHFLACFGKPDDHWIATP
jgi:sulfotransferase family protein